MCQHLFDQTGEVCFRSLGSCFIVDTWQGQSALRMVILCSYGLPIPISTSSNVSSSSPASVTLRPGTWTCERDDPMETILSAASFAAWCTSLRDALLPEVSSCHRAQALSDIPGSGQCSSNLLYKDSSCNASPTDFTALRPRHTGIVANHKHLDVDSCCSCFLWNMSAMFRLKTIEKAHLDSHAEVKHIASIVHDNDQNTFRCVNTTQKTSSDLLCRG